MTAMTKGMTRKERREEKQQTNFFFELLKVQTHFFPWLSEELKKRKDPRGAGITYPPEVMLSTGLVKNLVSLRSMREMKFKLNTEECIANIWRLAGHKTGGEEIPHYDTENDYLEKLETEELEKIRRRMIRSLLKGRSLEDFRLFGREWCVILDGTGLYHFHKKHCEHCLRREMTDPKTGEKRTIYLHHVLEAKLLCGEMVLSIGSEFIENENEDVEKQDCERKAFYRLAERIKKQYPRLPICIVADSLYACEPVFELCERYGWEWIIRFKDGSIPTIAEEAKAIQLAGGWNTCENGRIQYENEIVAKHRTVNLLRSEKRDAKQNITQFQYLTSYSMTNKRAVEIERIGRARWKIENEGFQRQKEHRYYIGHTFSKNYRAMKNHYLLAQLADILMQLYEHGAAVWKRMPCQIKEISSLLLASISSRFLTEEDIAQLGKPIRIRFS